MSKSKLNKIGSLHLSRSSSASSFELAPSATKVTKLLRLLVKRLVGNALLRYASSASSAQQYEDGLLQYCFRILTSRLYPEVEQDHFFIAQLIKKSLVNSKYHEQYSSSNMDDQEVIRFDELNTKLLSRDVLKNKWAVLYLLHQLSDRDDIPGDMTVNLPLGEAFSFADNITHGMRDLDNNTNDISSSISSSQKQQTKSSTNTDSIQILNMIDSGGASNIRGTNSNTRTRNAWTSQRHEVLKHLRSEVPESVLVRDVIYTFQGTDGRYVKYNAHEDAYMVNGPGVSKPMRHLIRRICELGWMYRRVRNYVNDILNSQSVSLTEQSFCGALQEEFTNYYRMIATLETQLFEDRGNSIVYDSDDIDFGTYDDDAATEGQFTLRRLFVWIQEPLQRLQLLAMLVDAAKGTKGGALATAIGSFLLHGDPFVHSFVNSLMQKLRQPLYAMIAKWISSGELVDPFNEFFIASDPDIGNDELWTKKYTLRKEMIPSFIAIRLAEKILVTGKSINFLRHCCKESEWIVESPLIMDENLDFQQDIELETAVDEAAKLINQQLMLCMMNNFKFREHCLALKKYLLLGQGDFIQHLMNQLYTDLSKRADELRHHNLMNVLHSTIRASNAQYEDEDILSRLSVRLLTATEGDCGWDVFSLDYVTTSPINVVLSRSTMSRYLRVFGFLWRLKRVEMSLIRTWGRNEANKILALDDARLSACTQRGYFLRNEMNHIIRNLHNYMMFEVLECAWTDFCEDMDKATNLDELIAAHRKYLQSILEKSLMGERKTNHPVVGILLRLFNVVVDFSFLQAQLHRSVEAETLRRKHIIHQIRSRTNKDQWGTTADEENEDEKAKTEVKQIADRYYSKLRQLEQEFHRHVFDLFKELTSDKIHSDVRFLKLRLDFNEFYLNRGVGRKEEDSTKRMHVTPK